MASRTAGNGTKRLTKPVIRELLKGRKLTYKSSRPKNRSYTNNYGVAPNGSLPKPYKNPATGRWVVHVQRHEGWNRKDYRHKASAMIRAGKRGELSFVKNTKPKRTGAQADRRDLEEYKALHDAARIHDKHGPDAAQEFLDRRLKEIDSQEADHTIELQIDGDDVLDNLKMIDQTTNHGMGGQLRSQLSALEGMGMKPGDLIEVVELPGVIKNK